MMVKPIRGPLPWLVLLGLFVAAVVYIRVVVPDADAGDRRPAGTAAHAAEAHGDGLSDSHDGYLLSPVTLPDRRGSAVPLAFRILGPDGAPVTGYESVLERPMHLYVVREDLSFYQHLHPELAGDTWTATAAVPDGGVYRVYAEFTPKGRGTGHTVLGTPFVIPGDTSYVSVPAPAASASAGGFTVHRLDGTASLAADQPGSVRFRVLDAAGAPVTALEPYLGVYAHVSAFDTYAQSLTHLHPVLPAHYQGPPSDGVLTFHTRFPHRGQQRLFLQFQVGGAVYQAAFTVTVT